MDATSRWGDYASASEIRTNLDGVSPGTDGQSPDSVARSERQLMRLRALTSECWEPMVDAVFHPANDVLMVSFSRCLIINDNGAEKRCSGSYSLSRIEDSTHTPLLDCELYMFL